MDDVISRKATVKALKELQENLMAAGDPFLAGIMNRAIACVEELPKAAAHEKPIPKKSYWQCIAPSSMVGNKLLEELRRQNKEELTWFNSLPVRHCEKEIREITYHYDGSVSRKVKKSIPVPPPGALRQSTDNGVVLYFPEDEHWERAEWDRTVPIWDETTERYI